MISERSLCPLLACMVILLSIPACAALYDFEGIPLHTVAKGAVQGDVLTSGSYGLTAPPVTCSFTLDRKPAFARVYAGGTGCSSDRGSVHYQGG